MTSPVPSAFNKKELRRLQRGELNQGASLGNDHVPAPSGFSACSCSLHIPCPGTSSCLTAEILAVTWLGCVFARVQN